MSFAVTKSLDAAATNTTGIAAATDSSTVDGGHAVTGVLVHVFGDGATTSSTTVEQSLDKVAWAPALYTVTNVSASGVILVGPPAPYTRAKTVCSSGAVSAYIIPSADVAPAGWKTAQAANTGTLTSVGLVVPAELSAAGSPLTADGDITVTWATQTANKVFASATSGGAATPAFRALVAADVPARAGAAKLTDGAIAVSDSDIFITKGSALGASTLATPTATTHDNWTMTITSTTAFAHVITVETGKVNGAAATGITFTSAAIGDSVTLKAWQGIWYIVATRGTITLA